jgi:hypothetical protein
MISLLRAGWLSIHSRYTPLTPTRIAFEIRGVDEGKATGILNALPFTGINVRLE